MSSPKRKPGRPTKLNAELCRELERLVNEWNPFDGLLDKNSPLDKYLRLCSKDSLAHELGISRDSLNEYVIGEGEFSDAVKRTISFWESKRNAYHLRILPHFQNPASWIFLAKNFNQFTDTLHNETAVELRVTYEDLIPEAIHRVELSDPSMIARSVERAKEKKRV